MTIARAAPTHRRFSSRLLGFEVVDERERRTRLAVNGEAPGHRLESCHRPTVRAADNGLGTVHHVAMAIATEEEQLTLRESLLAAGVGVTEVRDRQYFTSIYFREPGGVLFEVATMPPGFAVDEPLAELGRALKLPPWEEPHRRGIEAGLDHVRVPGVTAAERPTRRPAGRHRRARRSTRRVPR